MKRVLFLTISAVAALSMYSCKDMKMPGKDAEATEDVVVADTIETVKHSKNHTCCQNHYSENCQINSHYGS